MNKDFRTGLLLIPMLAALGGCSSVHTVASRIAHPFTRPSPTVPPPAGLDDYKTLVARHVVDRNPEHRYAGTLPPMLPAIVVLEITVDADGRMTDVEVQRSRDDAASRVALASMRRSTPLPRPTARLAGRSGTLKFSETFLFADKERYQLRSLADVQASE
jgi:protein TonB